MGRCTICDIPAMYKDNDGNNHSWVDVLYAIYQQCIKTMMAIITRG